MRPFLKKLEKKLKKDRQTDKTEMPFPISELYIKELPSPVGGHLFKLRVAEGTSPGLAPAASVYTQFPKATQCEPISSSTVALWGLTDSIQVVFSFS